MLRVVGCDELAVAADTGDQGFIGGCFSICWDNNTVLKDDDYCTGNGCCETRIPEGIKNFSIDLGSVLNHTRLHGSYPCGYAYLADEETFNFRVSDLSDPNYLNRTVQDVPMVLDWAIGEGSCDEARKSGDYSCREPSDCVDFDNGLGGYRCRCSEGYEGNPYLTSGCTG